MNWLHHALHKLTARRLASPLAIWGKLPTHTDYVAVNTGLPDAQAWQRWVAEQWRPPAVAATRRARARDAGWLHLEPPAARAQDMADEPVAFQLPAPTRSPSPQWWRGAMVTSRDGIGRPHPLIVYQRVSGRWLMDSSLPAVAGEPSQDLLYWLVRMLARWQAHHEDLGSLSQSIAAMGRLLTPGLPELLGLASVPASTVHLNAIVDSLGPAVSGAMPRPAHSRGAGRTADVPVPGQPVSGFWLLEGRGARWRGAKAWPELWSTPS